MPLNGQLDLISYFSWSLIGDQIAIKRRQKNEFIALGIKRQNALFHALPLAPFTAWLHLIYIQPPAIVNNNTNENSVTQNGKKRVEGELSTEVCWRSSKGVVNIMANYWTQQRQGAGCTSEPFLFLPYPCGSCEKKRDCGDFYIH